MSQQIGERPRRRELLPEVADANDRRLVTALHRWFGAQLSEHGADAEIE